MKSVCVLLSTFLAALHAQQPGTIEIHSQQWLDTPSRHLEIRGTLNDDTPFLVLLPPREVWQDRIMQYLGGGFGGKLVGASGQAAYALSRNAVFVESTQGHTGALYDSANTLTEISYEASYAVMQYAKARCVEIYGKERQYSYVSGASGGAFRATALMDRFPKVYDGAVAAVGGGTLKIHWYYGSLFDYYQPLLKAKAEAMMDAVGPSGTGDPFSALTTAQEKEALRMVLAAGLPKMLVGNLRDKIQLQNLMMSVTRFKFDPAYFDDFWKLGYGGREVEPLISEDIEGTVREAFIETTASRALSAGESALIVNTPEVSGDLSGYTLVFTSGKLAGQSYCVRSNEGEKWRVSGPSMSGVAPGDKFRMHNRDLLAWLRYHRHIADADEPAAREFYRNGKALYPQRSREAMRFLDETDRQVGKIRGKIITIFGTMDPWDWPTLADRYHRAVRKHLGDSTAEHFRIHFIERCPHGIPREDSLSRLVPRSGAVYKAQDDLMAWIEDGRCPRQARSIIWTR